MFSPLFRKELTLELRRKSVASGLALYLFATVFICYLSFSLQLNLITPIVWSSLFWIIILFSAVNTIAKSFIGEKRGNEIYLYSIARPEKIILSKIFYNLLLTLVLSFIGYFLFSLFLFNPIVNKADFFVLLFLVSHGFSGSLTLLSAISAKTNNSNILMAVLSLPVVIGILLLAIKVTKNCIDGIDPSASYDELVTLFSINCLVTAVSYLLFPYIWRS